MKRYLFILPLLFLIACANEARLVQEGNESFANEAYDAAAQAYTEAQQAAPELAEPVYNQANTHYRQEGLAEANSPTTIWATFTSTTKTGRRPSKPINKPSASIRPMPMPATI
jgi:hypothetical protein